MRCVSSPSRARPRQVRSLTSTSSACAQWAKERFEEYFEKPAEVVNSYLSQPNFIEAAKQSGETSQLVKIKSFLVDNKPLGFDECIVWAREQFETEYGNEIKQLLYSLPKDLVRLARCAVVVAVVAVPS